MPPSAHFWPVRQNKDGFLHFYRVHRSSAIAQACRLCRRHLPEVASTETDVLPLNNFGSVILALVARAVTSLVETPNARRISANRKISLVIHSAAPVRDASGQLRLVVLAGGVLSMAIWPLLIDSMKSFTRRLLCP